MQRGATWLGEKLQTAGGRSIVYWCGTEEIEITATPNIQVKKTEGMDGIATEENVYGWTITASELVRSDGNLVKPKKGHQIVETLNGQTVKWDVLPKDENSECFEWMDASELLMVVYVKRVE